MENVELVKKYFIPTHSVEGANNICRWINLPPKDSEIAVIFHNGMIFENVYARQVFIESISHWILQSDYDRLKKESP
jgi:hypothetical protein